MIYAYIFTPEVHTCIFITQVSHMFFFWFAHFSPCQTSSAAVSAQEEESFRKATEFVLLHSPQQGNLKEEAPLRCGHPDVARSQIP